MSKQDRITQWRAVLVERRGALKASAGAAQAGTRVDGDHRPANRGERAAVTSSGYLTAGLQARLAELEEAIDLLDRVGSTPRNTVVTGALTTLEDDDGNERRVFVLPGGDGTELDGVVVVSPSSPVARAVWGMAVGDAGELIAGGDDTMLEVVEVL